MIIDSYDGKSKPFLRAEDLYQEVERNDVVTLVTFKQKVVDYVIDKYNAKVEIQYPTTNGTQDIYSFIYEGKKYQIYMSPIGAAIAAIVLKEVSVVTGSHKFIYFGSCGVLNEAKCRGKVIVPSEAYRDEGISYHYAPASDYIEVRNYAKISEIFKSLNIPYVTGRTWTTDAIYMETADKVKKRKEDGCITVEMEVAGVEAVSRFYNIDNYHLLFSADSLEHEENWDRVDFGGDKELALQIEMFEVALKLASKL